MKHSSKEAIMGRLQRGERYWPAEIALRAIGLGLLALCALVARALVRLVSQPPPHSVTLHEFAAAAAAFFCLTLGLVLTFVGPGLFRLMPKPPRALF